MEIVAYCYSGCGTCRKALSWLESHGRKPRVIPIRETPPTVPELQAALAQLGSLRALFNTSGGDYKEMGLKDKLPTLSEREALELLASRGNLVKRPFVRFGARYLVGFREAEWLKVLG